MDDRLQPNLPAFDPRNRSIEFYDGLVHLVDPRSLDGVLLFS